MGWPAFGVVGPFPIHAFEGLPLRTTSVILELVLISTGVGIEKIGAIMRTTVRVLAAAAATATVLGSATGVAAAAPGDTGSASGVTADLVGTPSTQVSFQCGLSVTNRGPAVATNVRVYETPFTIYNLGDLAPGETKTSYYTCFLTSPTKYQYALSSTLDPNPGNNGGRVFPY